MTQRLLSRLTAIRWAWFAGASALALVACSSTAGCGGMFAEGTGSTLQHVDKVAGQAADATVEVCQEADRAMIELSATPEEANARRYTVQSACIAAAEAFDSYSGARDFVIAAKRTLSQCKQSAESCVAEQGKLTEAVRGMEKAFERAMAAVATVNSMFAPLPDEEPPLIADESAFDSEPSVTDDAGVSQ